MYRTWFLTISILLLLMGGCSRASPSPLDEMVDIGTHQIYIHCVGSGKPTVVIDTGVGETFESWEPDIEEISAKTRVCAYHRAGYGQSEAGPLPRDSQREASELHQLLVNSKENKSLVLVGHSLGALNMQVFAHLYPDQVRGLVLIDPPPLAWMQGEAFPELRELFEGQLDELQQTASAASASEDEEDQKAAAFLTSIASENEELFGKTACQVSEIQSFGELPLIVIGATQPEPGFGEFALAYRQFWNDENRALAEKSSVGKFLLAEGSSHHVHLDAPDIVINAILDLGK